MLKIEQSLPKLFCKIFIYLRENQKLCPSFQQAIKLIEHWDLIKIKTWKYCLHAIFGNVLHDDIYENTELLDADDCSLDDVILVSLLFSYARKPVVSKIDCSLSNAFALNILKYHVPKEYLSKNFKLWFATLSRNISRQEIRMESTRNFNSEFHLKNFETAFNHPGLPHMVYRRISMFNEQAELYDSTEVFFLSECILTYLVGYSMENSESEFCLTDEALENHKDKVASLDKDALNAIYPLGNDVGMETFICDYYLSRNEPYSCWIAKLACGLINQISFNIPHIICLYPLCKASTTFSELALNDLFFLSMTYDPKSCLKWSDQIFSQLTMLLNVKDFKIKLRLLFSVIKMIRMGSRYKERNCLRAYSS